MPRSLILILWLTVAASLPLMRAGFVYEDDRVLGNSNVQTSFQMAPWERQALTAWTYRLNRLLDPTGQALGWHLVNLGLHLVNGVLLFQVARRVLPPAGAVAAAGLFLVHPLSMSAVAYVAARSNVLATTGLLLGLCCLVRPRGVRLSAWRTLGLVAASLAAVSAKESAIAAVLLWPWTECCLQPGLWRWWAVVSSPVVGHRLRFGGAVLAVLGAAAVLGRYVAGEAYAWSSPDGAVTYGGLQLVAAWRYLALLVWPVGFSIDHDLAVVPPILVGVAAALSVALVVCVVRTRSTCPVLAWGIGLAALSLAPRFVVRLPEYLTEAHMYPALVGLAIAAGWAWGRLSAVGGNLSSMEDLST